MLTSERMTRLRSDTIPTPKKERLQHRPFPFLSRPGMRGA